MCTIFFFFRKGWKTNDLTAISFQIRAVKVRDSSTLMVRSKINMQGINNEYGDRISAAKFIERKFVLTVTLYTHSITCNSTPLHEISAVSRTVLDLSSLGRTNH